MQQAAVGHAGRLHPCFTEGRLIYKSVKPFPKALVCPQIPTHTALIKIQIFPSMINFLFSG